MLILKIAAFGASSGVILPKDTMAHPKVRTGDAPYLAEAASGGYRLVSCNPDLARQMEPAEGIMRDNREAPRAR